MRGAAFWWSFFVDMEKCYFSIIFITAAIFLNSILISSKSMKPRTAFVVEVEINSKIKWFLSEGCLANL
ncbi:hypothetical protein CK938_05145 [Bacillus cereus]|nr:hypothetical protein CK938_05145 [Bacillus cereus]